jgi:hypothetical protein
MFYRDEPRPDLMTVLWPDDDEEEENDDSTRVTS